MAGFFSPQKGASSDDVVYPHSSPCRCAGKLYRAFAEYRGEVCDRCVVITVWCMFPAPSSRSFLSKFCFFWTVTQRRLNRRNHHRYVRKCRRREFCLYPLWLNHGREWPEVAFSGVLGFYWEPNPVNWGLQLRDGVPLVSSAFKLQFVFSRKADDKPPTHYASVSFSPLHNVTSHASCLKRVFFSW